MLKIYDKLWYIKRGNEDLAYMTYHEDNKAFDKRKSTGIGWARTEEGAAIIGNTPIEGFTVGQSVSRWTTSNKVFRVKDPRGFEVEIPTDNLAMLLQTCTTTNSVIQEKCVWGREGSNHILLNEGSTPYQKAMSNMDKLAQDVIKPKDHTVGDLLSTVDGDSYLYLGKIKVTYEAAIHKQIGGYVYGRREVSEDPVYTTTLKDKIVRLYYSVYKEDFSDLSTWAWYIDKGSKFVSRKTISSETVDAVMSSFKDNTGGILNFLPSRLKKELPEEYIHCNGVGSYYADYVVKVKPRVEYIEEKT